LTGIAWWTARNRNGGRCFLHRESTAQRPLTIEIQGFKILRKGAKNTSFSFDERVVGGSSSTQFQGSRND
jgi:hypothetical protein